MRWTIAATVMAMVISSSSAVAGQLDAKFICRDQNGGQRGVIVSPDGQLQVLDLDTQQPIAMGQYSYDQGRIRLSVPSLGFDETSAQVYIQSGLLLAFQLPSVLCGLTGHSKGPSVTGYAKCPAIKYVPNVGWHDNAFEFYADRSVKWRRWRELSSVPDTIYGEFFGSYLIEGDRFLMAFPFKDEEQILTGQINANGSFLIAELEPEKGPCVPQ